MLNLPLRADDKFADHVRDATGKIIARCEDELTAAAIVERCNGFDGIKDQTFRIEYSPNCPKPFLIRFVAKGCGYIRGDEQDIAGCGMTLDEAITAALKQGESRG